jgi:hypothetical protein
MRRAIQLDYQPAFRTIKIDNVATYTELPSTFLAQKLSTLQACPKDGFGGCCRFPEILTKRFL